MKIRRFLSFFLVLTILLTLLPAPVRSDAANYTITISHVGQGTADFGGGTTSATLASGTQTQFQTIPANYYRVSRITINGIEQVVQNNGGSHVYPFTVDGNKTIVVYFSTSTAHTPSVVFDTADAVNMLKHANTSSYSNYTNVSLGTVYDYNNSAEHCAILSPSAAGNDPFIYMCYDAYGAIPTTSYNYMVITAKIPKTNSKTYENGFLWPITTGASPSDYNVNSGFGYGFKWINDGQWHDYVFKLQGVSGWSGHLKALRLDYFDSFSGNAPTSDKFYLRSIKFITGSVSKPTVSVNTSAFNTGSLSFTASYSGLDNYMTDNFNQTQLPFIGIYADGTSPGTGSALQWQFVTGNSGSVKFPITAGATDKSGGSTLGQLPPGNYKVWLAYDAAGTLHNKGANLNNAYYATQYWNGTATPVSLGTTSRSIRIDPKVTITAPSSGTLVVKNSSGTTLSSGNFVQYGSNITIEATPPAGYRVNKITVSGGTSKTNGTTQGKITYTTAVKANVTISVSYTRIYKISYSQPTGGTITVTNNSSGATISNGAYVENGTVIKVTASAKSGYTFKSLTVAGSSFTSGNTKTISADTSISASFTVNQYTLSYTASPTGGTVTVKNSSGTTISSGTKVNYNTSLTVTATAKAGYTLSALKYGSTSISSGGSFNMPAANTTITATFTANKYKMTITNTTGVTITVKDASGNSVSSGTSVTYGTKLTVTLTPSSGYRVLTAKVTGATTKTQSYSVMKQEAVTYTYTVEAKDFTVTGTAGKIFKVSYSQVTGGTIAVTNNSGGATISNGAYVDTGTVIKVTVTEATGYNLSTLKAGSTSLSNGGTYTVSAATTVAATYVKEKYKVTISASNGTVTVKNGSTTIASGTEVEYGTVLTVTATPATGYKLSTLKAGSTSLSSGGTFTLTAATTVTGTFTKQSYVMTITNPTGATITVKDASGNAVATGASVPYQSVLTVTLTPSSGYRVKNVTINGTSKQTYTTMSTTAVTYTYTVGAAAFTVSGTAGKIYKVTITNPTGGTVTVKNGSTSVSSGSYVDTGTSLTITLTPDAGYRVKTITAAGTSIKDNSTISNAAVSATHSITAATTYSGTCGKIYKVTISNPSNGTVTVKNGSTSVTSGSYVDTGTSLTITLTPGAGYRVKTITAAGSSIKSNSTISSAAVSATDAIDADTTYSGTVGAIYKVTISNPSGGKVTVKNGSTSVSSGGYVDTGTSLTITLTPNSGYRVKTITAAGSSIKSNSTISNAAVSVSHTITADTTYSGTCGQIFNVSVGVISNNGSVTLSKTGLADVNSTITITATPEPGYALNTLYVNGVAISGNTFKVTGATVVTAKFISVFEVEVFAQTVGSAISSTSIKNTAGAVSNKFTQGTVSIATTEYNNILGKYGSTVTVSVTGITSGVRFLGWYDKNGNTYDRLLSTDESYVLSAGLHTNMQIVAVFTDTTETDTVFNFRNVYGQAVQTLVASKGSYVPVTEITATPFKSGSVFTGWEFLKNAYKSTAVKKTLDPDGDGTTSTYYLIDGTTQPTYKYAYSILYKESSCATPLFIYVNGAGGVVDIDGAYTKVNSNKVVITVTGEGKVNNASSASVAYNTTVTATATGTGTFIGWIDKTNGTTRYSAEAFTTDNVTYYPYISYEKTFSFKALNAMTIQPVYGTSAGNRPNVSMNSVIQLQNNTADKNNKYTAYGMFTATPGDGYEIVEWGTLFFVASDASTLPTTVITNASTGATETVNMLTLETTGPMQISRNIYEDNSNPSGQYAAGIKVASARTIYVRMYCTYSYTDASTGELKYAVTYSDTYVFSTAAYSSSTASGFVSNVTRYEEPSSSLDNSGAIELF